MAVTYSSSSLSGTDLSLSGDLTVSGTTTTINTAITTLVDPIIHLQTASGGGDLGSDTNKDVGLALQYHTGSAAKQAFLGWDDSASKLTFIADASLSSEVVSGSVGTIVAAFEGDLEGDVTGNVSGSAGSVTGTAAVATTVTVSANNTADETIFPVFVDAATGNKGLETDTGLTYNPSTGVLTATFAGNITGALTGNASGTAATVTTASQGNITTLAALTSLGAAGATTDIAAGDVTMYNAADDGNPTISLGSGSGQRLVITTSYVSGGQLLDYVKFSTVEASSTANRGKYIFDVDGTDILTVDDGGIDIASGKTFAINGSDIATTDTTYTAGDGLTLTSTDFDLDASLTTVTSIVQAGLKVGRDAHNLVDFTTDDKLIFRVADVNEVELVADVLQPVTNDGVALGTTSLGWSDLHLATGGVIDWANGEMTITEGDANTLTVAGGTFATAAMTGTTITASTNFTRGDTVITDGVITDTSGLQIAAAVDLVANTLTTTGSLQVRTIDYSDGDLAMTIADGGGVTFAQGVTMSSNVTLGENQIILDPTIGADHTVSGIVVTGIAGSTVTYGDLVHLAADNKWDDTDADATATSIGRVGICLTGADDTDPISILVYGYIRDDSLFAFTSAGQPLYVHTGAGLMSQTAPSGSGDVVRVVGYADDDDDTVFFNPDNSWVEIS